MIIFIKSFIFRFFVDIVFFDVIVVGGLGFVIIWLIIVYLDIGIVYCIIEGKNLF